MVDAPRVTLILPVKDGEDYVGTTMKSVALQFDDLSALEVIAINDGSKDATGDVLRYYGRHLPNFRVIENDAPSGLASARNQGLRLATGRRIAFIDGDDWMAPRRLQSLADAMDALDCDFVRTDHVTAAGFRREVVRAPWFQRHQAIAPREAIMPRNQRTMVDYPYAWAGMFDRRLYDDGLLAFDDGLFTAEDRPWIWRLFLEARSFAVVDAPYLFYRREVEGSLTRIIDSRQLHFIRAFDLARQVLERADDAERFWPKLTWNTLAICEHQLTRAGQMTSADRQTLQHGVRDLMAALPAEHVAEALRNGPGRRRLALSRYHQKGSDS
ncbi:glycosyltransferase family 2 protein [Demequina soli]|uniref:glycosyltransferase family 2 protein n=1 Tax=Demequina soli TaxID=1638987 RepID=UPI0007853D93|nr:glycosyltransferase family 2 protein [Demequina soli]